jgi:hypothetical protein
MKHLGCMGGMWLGMSLGGRWLVPGFAECFGRASGMHLAMVTGMVVGAGFGHWLFWRHQSVIVNGRQPPRAISQVAAN